MPPRKRGIDECLEVDLDQLEAFQGDPRLLLGIQGESSSRVTFEENTEDSEKSDFLNFWRYSGVL